MKRRDFLKLLGVAPLVPSVLAAKESVIGIDTATGADYNVFTPTVATSNMVNLQIHLSFGDNMPGDMGYSVDQSTLFVYEDKDFIEVY